MHIYVRTELIKQRLYKDRPWGKCTYVPPSEGICGGLLQVISSLLFTVENILVRIFWLILRRQFHPAKAWSNAMLHCKSGEQIKVLGPLVVKGKCFFFNFDKYMHNIQEYIS